MTPVLERFNADVSHFALRTRTFPRLYSSNAHAPGSHMLRLIVTLTMAIVTAVPALIGGASAQSIGSSYTSTAEKDCHTANNTHRDASISVAGSALALMAYGRFATTAD